jgi:hypothetical protein
MGRPIFEWSMARCVSKNGHQKDMCLKETRLCVRSNYANHFRRNGQHDCHDLFGLSIDDEHKDLRIDHV